MAHLVEQMAYVGDTPWHGLGQKLSPNQPLEIWRREAGMDWDILDSPVHFKSDVSGHLGQIHTFPEQKVLYRSDTKQPLSVVSNRYQVVQPKDVIEFYRDLTELSGYELETAGVLQGGRKFWALARTGLDFSLRGKDLVNNYILLATSCDRTLATTATPTTVRVVCNNTLEVSLNGATSAIKVPHSTKFNPHTVKAGLGIAVSQWDDFKYQMQMLSRRQVSRKEAMTYFVDVICELDAHAAVPEVFPNERALKRVHDLFDGSGRGSNLESSQGTAWGMLSAVTEFVDHHKQARNTDNRLNSAWFGQGALIKQRALNSALKLVA